jgi:aryl-alcohol dehydrogenase-like predicted oxidoreductase
MKIRKLGRTGLKVSNLCLGTMTFGNAQWGCDESTSRKIVDRFLDAGGNFVDTADVYSNGVSEEITGRAVQGRRQQVILATKVAGPMGTSPNDLGLSRKHILDAVDASLRRLGTDYIDLYQVHAYDPTTPLDETLRALDDCVRSGKVRYLGCSNYSAWQLMKATALARELGTARYDCLQPQYSLACRFIEREHLPLCREEGIGVIPWSPLAGGLLTGKIRRGQDVPTGTRRASTPTGSASAASATSRSPSAWSSSPASSAALPASWRSGGRPARAASPLPSSEHGRSSSSRTTSGPPTSGSRTL